MENNSTLKGKPNQLKKTVVGIIPSEWEVRKFKEITDVLKCGIASTPKYVDNGIPFLSSQNVKENKIILDKYKYVSEEFHKKLTKSAKPQRGDILYTRVGASFGKAAVVNFDWEFSVYVSLTLIRMKYGYNNDFYAYLLNSDRYVDMARKTVFQGGGVQNLNVKEVEKFDMVVPPLKEQKKISNILLTWDKAIELKEIMIKQKIEQKKRLFDKLLTGEIRLAGFSDKWKEVALGELGETYNGLTGKTAENFGSGKPYVTYKSIFNNARIDLSSVELVSIKEGEKQNCAQYGDIFFTISSETPGEVGMCSVLLDEVNELYLNSFCFGFRLNNFKSLLPEFAKFLLRSNIVRKQMYKLAQGSTRFNISPKEVMKITIKLPSIEEQKLLNNILNSFEQDLYLLKKEVDELKEQKKGLMQILLTGKVRVKA